MARRNRPNGPAVRVYTRKELPQMKELEKLLETPEGFWRGARLVASDVFWTFAPAIQALIPNFKSEADVPGLTMGVDKYYRCYINTDFVDYSVKLAQAISTEHPCSTCGATEHHNISYVAGVICHESQHPVRDHSDRAEELAVRYPRMWNVAADLEINDDLLQCFKSANESMPGKPRLCLPFFPKISLLDDNGDRVIDKQEVWHSFEPQTFLINDTPHSFTFDGYRLHMEPGGLVLDKDETFEIDGMTFRFEHGLCMLPRTFREPEYAKFNIDFPDDQVAETYYFKLLDMRNEQETCPMCGKPFDEHGSEQQESQGEGQEGKGDDEESQGGQQGQGQQGQDEGQGEDQQGQGQRQCPHPGHRSFGSDQSSNMNNNGQDCGSGATGVEAAHELGAPNSQNPGISEAESKAIKREIAQEIQKASATRGNVPAGMVRWAAEVLRPPKVDWRAELRKQVRQAVTRTYGHTRRTWSRLGRSSASTGYKFLYPSRYTPVPKVGIVLDTSGSMGWGENSPLMDAYNEVEGICKSAKARVTFVSVDAAAGEVQEISSLKQAAITGGGGTDMRIGIKALEEYGSIDIVVVLTDGWTPWPDTPPRKAMTVVAALCGDGAEQAKEQVPSFIKAIVVKDEE